MKFYSQVVGNDVAVLLGDLRSVLPKFSGTTVLVTGANGFLMSYIVETLLAWNESGAGPACRVIALDNFVTGVPDRLAHLNNAKHLALLKHDISRPLDPGEAVHWIVHGASIASPMVYRQFPLETIDANVNGTRHLLELARQMSVRGMLIMSTSEIYGDPLPEFIPTPEDYRGNVSCTGPRACYDESKRMAETLGMTYHRLYGTPIKIIRPFNVYGPGLRLDDKRVLPDFVSQVLDGRPIELLSSGAPTRSFCYIRDAIALMLRALASDAAGEPFNVGNDEAEISMSKLAELVVRAGGNVLGRPPISIQRRVSEDKDYLVDNPQRRCPDLTKSRRSFPDWSAKVGLEEGITLLFRHFAEKRGLMSH